MRFFQRTSLISVGNAGACLNADGARFQWMILNKSRVIILIKYRLAVGRRTDIQSRWNWGCSSVNYKFSLCITGFPATCPYVTAVGATQINPGSNVTQPESACEQAIFSGGGFSNHFAMPAYQQRVVHQYLKKYKPDYSSDVWNSTGIVREIFPLYSD